MKLGRKVTSGNHVMPWSVVRWIRSPPLRFAASANPAVAGSKASEEHAPNDLVRYARRAEQAGFTFALISDHYHPWIDSQGHSPFVWSVIGAIAHATERLRLGTGVTC